jgi:hypothetical protein
MEPGGWTIQPPGFFNFTMLNTAEETILLRSRRKNPEPTRRTHHTDDARSGASPHGDTFNDLLENDHRGCVSHSALLITASHAYSPEQQQLCTGDAIRLCGSEIQLSDGCMSVFAPAPAATPVADRPPGESVEADEPGSGQGEVVSA